MFEVHQILVAEKAIWDELKAWASSKHMPLHGIESIDGIPTYVFTLR